VSKSLLLNYTAQAAWKRHYWKGLLSQENLESGRKHYQKFYEKERGTELKCDYWGYVLSDGKVRYLVDFGEKNPRKVLPIKIKDSDTVSYRGDAYERVSEYAPARFKSEKRMSFRELVDTLTCQDHTNPRHQKLLMMIALAQYMQRANIRVCSPPGTGKDSSVQTTGNLVGGAISVSNPTLAKLEKKAGVSWMVINEMMGLGKSEWNRIEQFLLTAGDLKPHMEKHSLGYNGGEDSFDISDLSLSVFYNDITAYPDDDFWDDRAKKAVKDRFPAIRVHGSFSERFDKINTVNINDLIHDNEDFYKDLIYTIVYYKDNIEDELERYSHDLLHRMLQTVYPGRVPQRHRDNLAVILKAFDLYSESQDEFNGWITVLVEAMKDYQAMLEYPELVKSAKRKVSRDEWRQFIGEVERMDTFTEKNQRLRDPNNQGDVKDLW